MSLDWLASSPFPSVFALVCLAVLAIMAFRKHQTATAEWGSVALTVFFALAVAAKNLAYHLMVAGPHGENSARALHDYSNALVVIVGGEVILIACLVVIAIHYPALRWAAIAVALACAYAALCLWGWQTTYAALDPTQVVHYHTPALPQWALAMATAGAVAAAVAIELHRRARSKRGDRTPLSP